LTRVAAEVYHQTFEPAIAIPVSPALFDAAGLHAGQSVLDVACGTGVIARLAAAQVGPTGRVVGVDVSPDMIAVARTVPTTVDIEWHEADAASLPLPDATFDVALCQMGLMFVADKSAALSEIRRVLVPGGMLVLSTPGAIQPVFEVMGEALARHIHPDLGAFLGVVFSMDDPIVVTSLLRDNGFRDVAAATTTTTLRLPPPREFLWQYIASTPLGAVVAAVSDAARTALEDDVADRWRSFVDGGGDLVLEQPIVLARGRT
jgi:SAM-dependent methyltransferase